MSECFPASNFTSEVLGSADHASDGTGGWGGFVSAKSQSFRSKRSL